MSIIKAVGVSIRYLTGDFKDIGLKEYVMRKLNTEKFVLDSLPMKKLDKEPIISMSKNLMLSGLIRWMEVK